MLKPVQEERAIASFLSILSKGFGEKMQFLDFDTTLLVAKDNFKMEGGKSR
jgi:hypothetical protein